MCADRARYEKRQAELLDALQGRADPTGGFAAADVAAASESLLRKRARAVAGSWPALRNSLGDAFLSAFAQYARESPPGPGDDGFADGLRFARSLGGRLADDAAVELLLARAVLTCRGSGCRVRRGLFAGALRLEHPRRVLFVIRAPLAGRRYWTIRIG